MSNHLQLLASSTAGLEAVVARELQDLGYDPKIISTGRIAFEADEWGIVRANLHLRAADRLLLTIASFPARDFDQLFEGTRDQPWDRYLPANAHFPVRGRSVKSQLSSVPACQRAVKKAIAEKLLAAHGCESLSDDPQTGPSCVVEVAILQDQVTLTLDTSGSGLHKRGYRHHMGPAPLRETLAAGLVLLSFWDSDRPFLDPFCGTGTIAIEAAMIGRNIPPGLNRTFSAETWPWISQDIWSKAREDARQAVAGPLKHRLLATDRDGKSLALARQDAQAAGVQDDLHLQQRDFHATTSKQKFGCLITNPPYGHRLGDQSELDNLYQAIPIVLARLKTWSHFILTGYPNFEKVIRQEADRRRKLYNAQIQCTYYAFHGPPPPDSSRSNRRAEDSDKSNQSAGEQAADEGAAELSETPSNAATQLPEKFSPPAEPELSPRPGRTITPAFGGLRPEASRQFTEFRNRLSKNARQLRRWPTRKGINVYRLYDRDVPEVPLSIDRYEDHLHITEYDRPHERTAAEHHDWLNAAVREACDTLEVDSDKAFVKFRRRQRGRDQHERYADDHYTIVVQEAGLKFLVNLSDYLDTGLFLDHRNTRQMVREHAEGKRMLNLFAYTGSFSVYAAAGGARSTTTVDLSNTYLDWAQQNLSLNNISPGDCHRFVQSDTMTFLESFSPTPQGHWDLAVVDPPTFSNSKRTDEIWEVQTGYVSLLNHLATLMSPGAMIYFSTNFRRFKFDPGQLVGFGSIREITRQTVPEDFRNKRIHRCWLLTTQTR